MAKQIREENKPRQYEPLNDDIYRGKYHYNRVHTIRGFYHGEIAAAKAKEMLATSGYPETILLVGHYFLCSQIYICENFCIRNGKVTAC